MEDSTTIGPKQDYKVLVRTITYNQAKYIKDTLDGVAMQETNFPFVHFVIDDASTDGEQEVIKAWMECNCETGNAEYIDIDLADIILVPHKTNPNCSYAFYFLKRNLYKEPYLKQSLYKPWRDHCQYEALCEGDDFWTDPLKLQKQVDILERCDYSICFHTVNLINKSGDLLNESIPPPDSIKANSVVSLDSYIEKEFGRNEWTFHTSSIIVRTSVLTQFEYEKTAFRYFPMGDLPLMLFSLGCRNGYYIKESMSCYRVFSGGYMTNLRMNPHSAINKSLSFICALKEYNYFTKGRYFHSINKRKCREYDIITSISQNHGISLCNISFFRYVWNFFPDYRWSISFILIWLSTQNMYYDIRSKLSAKINTIINYYAIQNDCR